MVVVHWEWVRPRGREEMMDRIEQGALERKGLQAVRERKENTRRTGYWLVTKFTPVWGTEVFLPSLDRYVGSGAKPMPCAAFGARESG